MVEIVKRRRQARLDLDLDLWCSNEGVGLSSGTKIDAVRNTKERSSRQTDQGPMNSKP